MRRIAPALPLLLALAAAPAFAQAVDPQNPYARLPPAQAAPLAPAPAPLQAPPCPQTSNDQVWVAGQSMQRGHGLVGAAQDYWSRMHPFQPPPGQATTCPPPAQLPATPLPPPRR